jgi:hypothetical protein
MPYFGTHSAASEDELQRACDAINGVALAEFDGPAGTIGTTTSPGTALFTLSHQLEQRMADQGYLELRYGGTYIDISED